MQVQQRHRHTAASQAGSLWPLQPPLWPLHLVQLLQLLVVLLLRVHLDLQRINLQQLRGGRASMVVG